MKEIVAHGPRELVCFDQLKESDLFDKVVIVVYENRASILHSYGPCVSSSSNDKHGFATIGSKTCWSSVSESSLDAIRKNVGDPSVKIYIFDSPKEFYCYAYSQGWQ